MKFKKGDRVKISSNSNWIAAGNTEANPNCEGTITDIIVGNTLPIGVKWDLGSYNTYNEEDLYLVNNPVFLYCVLNNETLQVFDTEQKAKEHFNNIQLENIDWSSFVERPKDKTKVLNYLGKEFEVPESINYIATNVDGIVNGFWDKPEYDNLLQKWRAYDKNCYWVGSFNSAAPFTAKNSLVEYG